MRINKLHKFDELTQYSLHCGIARELACRPCVDENTTNVIAISHLLARNRMADFVKDLSQ